MKLSEENIKEIFIHIDAGNDFLNMIPTEQETKAKTDKWDSIKMKSLYIVKEITN